MTLFEATGLTAWYRSADQELHQAFETVRDRASISRIDRQLVKASAAERLLSVNADARIMLARSLCGEIGQRLCVNEYWEHDLPIFFITIIPKAGIVSTGLRAFDSSIITNRLRAVLRGLDYLAIVEPGYFASVPPSEQVIDKQAISWHAHAILWNVTFHDLAALVDKLNKMEEYSSIVPQLPAVHARQVNNGELSAVIRYLLKAPSKAKRIQRYPWIKDGEFVRYADGEIKQYVVQKPSNLQPSERVRVFHAMKHLTLDRILVGGGEGKLIRNKALLTFDREAARRT